MNMMGKLFSHDKVNAETRNVHIISDLNIKKTTTYDFIFSKKEFNMKEKNSKNLEKEVSTSKLYVLHVKHSQTF